MCVYAHAPACRFILSPSAHPPGKRARPLRVNWSAPLDERLGPAGPGLLGFAWADGDGVNRLPPQPRKVLKGGRPSWSPRSPPEASNVPYCQLGNWTDRGRCRRCMPGRSALHTRTFAQVMASEKSAVSQSARCLYRQLHDDTLDSEPAKSAVPAGACSPATAGLPARLTCDSGLVTARPLVGRRAAKIMLERES